MTGERLKERTEKRNSFGVRLLPAVITKRTEMVELTAVAVVKSELCVGGSLLCGERLTLDKEMEEKKMETEEIIRSILFLIRTTM